MTQRLLDVEGRRSFIKSASAFAITIAALPPAVACQREAPAKDSAAAAPRPSRIVIAERQEPGPRLLMRGTVYDKDGQPAPGVRLFLYHTDAEGFYSRPVSDPRRARLRGTVWTDARGLYEFDTVKPGHYAGGSPPPMHIHVHMEPPGLPDHWVESFYFEGDPQLPSDIAARARGLERFTHVVALAPGASGALQGVRDFRIDAALATRNRLDAGWYRS